MPGFLDAIGAVSGVLGIIGFGMDLIPEDAPPSGASITVKAGGTGDDDPVMASDITGAYAWDGSHNWLGEAEGSHIDMGSVQQITIDSVAEGRQVRYVGISVGNDAVCVAWVTVKQKDDTRGGAWTGDVGAECVQHWYEQKETAGEYKDSGEDYYPRCTWLDGDHTGDTPSAAMKFNVFAYGRNTEETIEKGIQCEATVWGSDDAPTNGMFRQSSSGLDKLPLEVASAD